MKKFIISAAVAASMALTGCATTSADPNSYEGIVAQAQAAHAEAKKSAGNVWKQKKMKKAYVDHYLAKAADAKKKGDDKAAMKWAKEALKTANAEVAQVRDNANLKAAWEK